MALDTLDLFIFLSILTYKLSLAARMSALLTYRSRHSFESRFGRKIMKRAGGGGDDVLTDCAEDTDEAVIQHNEGNKNPLVMSSNNKKKRDFSPTSANIPPFISPTFASFPVPPSSRPTSATSSKQAQPNIYSAQSYLRYQGDKFVKRFDANCYISITRKLDLHDVFRDRGEHALESLPQSALIIGKRVY